MDRITVRPPSDQLDRLDDLADADAFHNRSEAVRTALADFLEEREAR